MADELVSALLKDVHLRVVLATTTALSRRAQQLHEAQATAAALLGMGLTGGALLASLQKERTRINLQLACDGPLRGFFVDAHQEGTVRGYVNNPYVQYAGAAGEWKWRPALGNSGFLSVLRDLGGGEYYRSSVELERFEVAGDLERYFQVSEQLPTYVFLEAQPEGGEVLGRVAGLLLQPLPDGDREALDRLRSHLAGEKGFSSTLAAHGAGGPVALLQALFPEHPLDLMSRYPLAFQCTCSRDRVKNALLAMGREELADVIAKDKKAEATCHFCSTQYVIPEGELQELLDGTGN
jgi:molecular chaperone Hsp33